MDLKQKIAVIIPAYRVADYILPLIGKTDDSVSKIVVVDDACPENSGKLVLEKVKDERLQVVFHEKNLGVGGAVKSGYRAVLEDESIDIAVKLDGDGQMDPSLIPALVQPILDGKVAYVKGNRFFKLTALKKMPRLRLFGNGAVSLINKISSGYWQVMDPTNGFTAIHRSALKELELDKIENGYFFESDMLFRLGVNRVKVADYAMDAFYGDEVSNLNVPKVIFRFPLKYLSRFIKRIFYTYFLRDFNAGSLQLVIGILLVLFGFCFGLFHWWINASENTPTAVGTVMLAALPLITGSQFLLGFLNYDIQNSPE